jgi:hypothetical protein
MGKSIKDASKSSVYSNASFESFSVAVPLDRDLGFVASFGIQPVSRVKYDLKSETNDPNFGIINNKYSGSGGLSKMYFGASYRLLLGISFGAQMEYYFGKIDYISSLRLPDSLRFPNVLYTGRKSFSGLGATFGLISPDMHDLLNSDKIDDLRFGFYASVPANVNTDTSITSTTSTGQNKIVDGVANTSIPLKYGVGLSLKFNKKYLIVANYTTQNWGNYTFAGTSDANLSTYHRFSAGIENIGEHSEYSSFWEQMMYRFGLSYEQTQYRLFGESVKQFAVHAGLSFPIGVANSIDISIVAGLRGKTDNQLLEEKFFGTSVSLSFGELWFVRRKR